MCGGESPQEEDDAYRSRMISTRRRHSDAQVCIGVSKRIHESQGTQTSMLEKKNMLCK